MKQLLALLISLSIAASLSGCCCGMGGYGPYGGGCPGGACGVAPGGYGGGLGAYSGAALGIGPTAFGPGPIGAPITAMRPLQELPTY